MKNKKMILGITVIIAVVALTFALTACILPEEDGSDTTEEGSNKDYDYTEKNGQITITKYKGEGVNVTIPSKIGGKPVTNIGRNAFNGSSLTSVTIPESITSIGGYAFANCKNLTSITIPDNVTSIWIDEYFPGGNFRGCASLTSVTIGKGITVIGDHTFADCTSLTSITIPNNVTTIFGPAFENTGLTSVNIPNSVTTIGASSFANCTNLTSVNLGNHVTSLNGFTNCNNLTEITIPASVTSIGNGAFAKCGNLTSVTFLGTIPSTGFALPNIYVNSETFIGNLRYKFYETDSSNGTPGTYLRTTLPGYNQFGWDLQS